MANKANFDKIIFIPCFIMTLVMLSSCNWLGPEVEKGCTLCYAQNYDSEALLEDGTCRFLYEDLIGLYSVRDSLFDSSGTYVTRSYELSIFFDDCNSEKLRIHNLGNLKNLATEEPVSFDLRVENNELVLIKQTYFSNVNEVLTYYYLERSSGVFDESSLRLNYSYIHDRQHFRGSLIATKTQSLL